MGAHGGEARGVRQRERLIAESVNPVGEGGCLMGSVDEHLVSQRIRQKRLEVFGCADGSHCVEEVQMELRQDQVRYDEPPAFATQLAKRVRRRRVILVTTVKRREPRPGIDQDGTRQLRPSFLASRSATRA